MATEKLDTEIRQEQISEAALNLIGSQGMKRLSIAAVARRVGLVPSAIYRHYKSKDDLLEAVLDLIGHRLFENVASACGKSSDSLECLKFLVMGHVRLIRENAAIPRVVFSDEVYGGNAARKNKMHRIISMYLSEVARIVREGQQQGQIRTDVDPEMISVMFLGVIQPAAVLWRLSEEKFDVTRHAEKAWKILSEALKTP